MSPGLNGYVISSSGTYDNKKEVENMKVKKAIDFLHNIIFNNDILTWNEKKRIHDEINELISLLQDLEKYKKIVNELEYYVCDKDKPFFIPEEYRGIQGGTIQYIIKTIKNRYFPQLVKKVITIEVEGKDVGWVIESFKDDVKNINREYKGNIKVNIKEEK